MFSATSKTMNTETTDTPDYAAFIAIDWADQKHTYSLQVADQTKKEAGTVEQKPEVIGPWVVIVIWVVFPCTMGKGWIEISVTEGNNKGWVAVSPLDL